MTGRRGPASGKRSAAEAAEAAERAEQDTGFRVQGVAGLSPNAWRFCAQNPQEARLVVAAALEAAADQRDRLTAADGASPRRIRRALPRTHVHRHEAAVGAPSGADEMRESQPAFFARQALDSELVGVSEAAARLGVSSTTVYAWVRQKMLVAWKTPRRGLTIPAAQILGPGKVVPGIRHILEIIENPLSAWTFLTQEWPFSYETVRPLDRLKIGDVEEVLIAAPGFGAASP